jgi:hypothetical protein
MTGLFWLSDAHWAVIEAFMPRNQPGARRVDDRRTTSGIVRKPSIGDLRAELVLRWAGAARLVLAVEGDRACRLRHVSTPQRFAPNENGSNSAEEVRTSPTWRRDSPEGVPSTRLTDHTLKRPSERPSSDPHGGPGSLRQQSNAPICRGRQTPHQSNRRPEDRLGQVVPPSLRSTVPRPPPSRDQLPAGWPATRKDYPLGRLRLLPTWAAEPQHRWVETALR